MDINDNTEELLNELEKEILLNKKYQMALEAELEEVRSIKQELSDMLVAFREYNERVLDIITED